MAATIARERKASSVLKRTAFAGGLPESVLEELAAIVVERHYGLGDILYAEGTPAEGFHLLLSGRVNFTVSSRSRRARLVGWVERGQAVGLSALVGGKPHAVTAVAALKVVTLFFPRTPMLALLAKHPQLWLRISLLLSAGVQQAYAHRAALRRSNVPA
jgi:CRP-like cAMP-binding protein